MPELPDVEVYREALAARVAGATLEHVADRSLSRLLHASWPKSIEDLG